MPRPCFFGREVETGRSPRVFPWDLKWRLEQPEVETRTARTRLLTSKSQNANTRWELLQLPRQRRMTRIPQAHERHTGHPALRKTKTPAGSPCNTRDGFSIMASRKSISPHDAPSGSDEDEDSDSSSSSLSDASELGAAFGNYGAPGGSRAAAQPGVLVGKGFRDV